MRPWVYTKLLIVLLWLSPAGSLSPSGVSSPAYVAPHTPALTTAAMTEYSSRHYGGRAGTPTPYKILDATPRGSQRRRGCFGARSGTDMSSSPPSSPEDGERRDPRGGGDAYSPMAVFKGWTKPGNMDVPGIQASGLPGEGETLDALVGHYRIFQLAKGNKYTNDDLLAAWYGTSWCPSASTVLDLGSGLGSVAMMSAFRLQGASFVTIEAQEVSYRLALRSVAFNGLADRFDQRLGDLRNPDVLDKDEMFDLITATPPYFSPESGLDASQHPQKQACRFELRGTVSDYCATASHHLAPGGLFVVAFPMNPPFQQERVERAAEDAGFVMVRRRPIVFREGNAPLLGLYAMMRKDHLPGDYQTWVEPPLVLRNKDGGTHPEFKALQLGMGMSPW